MAPSRKMMSSHVPRAHGAGFNMVCGDCYSQVTIFDGAGPEGREFGGWVKKPTRPGLAPIRTAALFYRKRLERGITCPQQLRKCPAGRHGIRRGNSGRAGHRPPRGVPSRNAASSPLTDGEAAQLSRIERRPRSSRRSSADAQHVPLPLLAQLRQVVSERLAKSLHTLLLAQLGQRRQLSQTL